MMPVDPANPYADYTPAQMYEFLSRYQLPRDRGKTFEYSNLGVGLLGHALARRAGTSHEALLHNGGTGGYRTFLGLDKARQRAVIVLATANSADDKGRHVLDPSLPLAAAR